MLNFAHSQVSLGQVALELGIAARVPRETIQVRQRFLHDELSRRRRAGKILHCRLQFEQERIGQRQATAGQSGQPARQPFAQERATGKANGPFAKE